MADALRDLGEPVLDRTLVLNLIRGLNGRFEAIGLHLRRGHPFPSFLQARNDLLLEELTMEATAPATALHAGAAAPSSGSRPPSAPHAPPAAPPQQRPPGQQQPSNGGGGKRARRGKRGGGGRGQMPNSGQQSAPWPNLHQPWTGSINMWPGPRPSTLPHPHALLGGVQQPLGGQQMPHALLAGAQQGWGVHPGVQQWALPPAGLYSPAVGSPG